MIEIPLCASKGNNKFYLRVIKPRKIRGKREKERMRERGEMKTYPFNQR